MTRRRLPNRRASHSFAIEVAGCAALRFSPVCRRTDPQSANARQPRSPLGAALDILDEE